jgi:hypothetical protein
MAFLVNPATYISLATFEGIALDYSLTGYTATQLTDLLVRSSGVVDSFLCRTYLPTQMTEQFEGVGTSEVNIGTHPIAAVNSVQLVMPGFAPFALPVGQLLIDYQRGIIRSWSPIVYQSLGISTVFPRNGLPIVMQFISGCGYAIPPPTFTLSSAGVNGTIPAGTYNVAVSTRTQPGESLPSLPQSITLSQLAGINVTITPSPGVFVNRVYYSQGPNTTLETQIAAGVSAFVPVSTAGVSAGQVLTLGFGTADCENVTVASVVGGTVNITGTTANAHAVGETIVVAMTLLAESPATNFATSTMVVTLSSLAAPSIGALAAPLTDTSPWPLPNAIVEATRLIALNVLYEQNNLANRGIYQLRSEGRTETWKSTEGQGGLGHPVMVEMAKELLQPYVYRGLS